MKKKQHARRISVTGWVTPHEWDRHTVLVAVSVVTDEFEKYVVGDTWKGRQLLNFVGQMVVVRGVVSGEDVVGNKVVDVIRYELVKNEPKRNQDQISNQVK